MAVGLRVFRIIDAVTPLAQRSFTVTVNKNRRISFASISAQAVAVFSIFLNAVEIERLYLAAGVPHSWWHSTGQPFIDANDLPAGTTVEFQVIGGPVSLRADYEDVNA